MTVSRTRLFADDVVAWMRPDLDNTDRQDVERRLARQALVELWLNRLIQVSYGQLASEADVAATDVNQINAECRVGGCDPQERVAEYLRDWAAKIAERQANP